MRFDAETKLGKQSLLQLFSLNEFIMINHIGVTLTTKVNFDNC